MKSTAALFAAAICSVTLGADGSCYVTGVSGSSNFPLSSGAFQTSQGGGLDTFVTKLADLGLPLAAPPDTDFRYPLIQISGRSRATLRARPACSAAAT